MLTASTKDEDQLPSILVFVHDHFFDRRAHCSRDSNAEVRISTSSSFAFRPSSVGGLMPAVNQLRVNSAGAALALDEAY